MMYISGRKEEEVKRNAQGEFKQRAAGVKPDGLQRADRSAAVTPQRIQTVTPPSADGHPDADGARSRCGP
ncbi:hypothetical protein NDU88_008604 [Pleurodeles waltl]|uniref:Uncharacterized protein n=1 Tax=Pleurodeles waltl TaxID=8319 RepID=A0AAV7PTK8_PLEWA|nr:hypothetical protein NDU88_008604 [Pleurodeles waltl]